jgi:predicted aspartyl protease
MENREGTCRSTSLGQPERSFDRPPTSQALPQWPALKSARFALALVVCSGLSSFTTAGDLTVPPPPKNQITEMPFSLYRGYLVVIDGRIGNLDHQNLLLDTGTSPSMIDQSVCGKLGLQGTTRDLALFNKKLAAQTVTLGDLQLGPLHPRNLQVMVADLSKATSGIGTHIDAVIGLDVLGGSSFTLDYQKRRIYFHATSERHSAHFNAGQQFITVDLTTGSRQLRLLLDTGTPHLVLFRNSLRDLDYDPTTVTGAGQNISGSVLFDTIILQNTKLGAEEMGPQRVSVVAGQPNVQSGYDGLVGISLLRPKRLSFDFERQLIAWSN